jgi:hypothetical protein
VVPLSLTATGGPWASGSASRKIYTPEEYAAPALEGGKRGDGDLSRPRPPLRTLAVTAAEAMAHPPSRAGAAEVGAAKEEDALRRCCEQLRVQYEPPSRSSIARSDGGACAEDATTPSRLCSPLQWPSLAIRWVGARTLVSGGQ